MRLPQFFINRPIFAGVLSIVILLVGALAYAELPVARYPEVAPPTIVVTAYYPGATPEVISQTVATPLEQEINGVENMLYMESQSTADGTMQLTITFALGTDIDLAQVLVQNRVAVAQPRLPTEVQQVGVTTAKSSPDLLLVTHMMSPDGSRDQLYISNYVYLQVKDVLARLDGVGSVGVFGGRQYSMRIWLDIERLSSLDLTAGDALSALRSQNIQVASGIIGQQPLPTPSSFQISIAAQGRLKTPEEFAKIVVKAGDDGRLVRLEDVARIELGAQDYNVNSYLDGKQAVAMVVTQRPGSNAVATAQAVAEKMEELSKEFPEGLEHRIVYNPTKFVEESMDEVFQTLLLSTLLVVLTVFLFLQSWRSTIIPVVAIPISLVGTFAVMQALGISLNSLSLFGLVLAIGIVVDDAIVVVENVERLIAAGKKPLEATRLAMTEVGSALIATTLVLVAVFVPTAFISGISGQFYRQFALTIASATVISTFVSLTLSPALSALLLRPKSDGKGLSHKIYMATIGWFFWLFNRAFDFSERIYARLVRFSIKLRFLILIIFVGLLYLTWFSFKTVPAGFIPPQDQGYLIISAQLPPGASLSRTDAVVKEITRIALATDGVKNAVGFAGFSGATRTSSPSAAAVFVPLRDASARADEGLGSDVILANLRQRLGSIQDAFLFVIAPPPVNGIGTGGGFKMQIQDRSGQGLRAIEAAAASLTQAANEEPGLVQVFSTFSTKTPQIFADIDRTKVRMLDVPLSNVFEALQTYLGSVYVNDFNYLGRTYRVTAQAEAEFRDEKEDISRLRTRSANGSIVPLGSVVKIKESTAPDRVVRYNLYPAADVNGDTIPGFSTGQALSAMERMAEEQLPAGMGYEWTDLAYQERKAGNTALFIFPLCVLLAFLALAAQYESWLLPLAVVLIVPTCILFALVGVSLRGIDNNILVQIGFVVLVGLACKNAILIVEFAKQKEDEGLNRFDAAVEACRLRLRPILMTALSFILGVIPLLFATGAGFEMRRALGTAVFSGMLGVSLFGLFLTPVFYVVLRKFGKKANPDQA